MNESAVFWLAFLSMQLIGIFFPLFVSLTVISLKFLIDWYRFN